MKANYGKENIQRVRESLNKRLRQLDENRSYREPDEETRFQNIEDELILNWRDDDKYRLDEDEKSIFYLSSAARDKQKWPSPGSYQVKLDTEIDNVIGCGVQQASIPLTEPTITANNNKVRYSFAPYNLVKTVEVPVGSYTGNALGLEISIKMNLEWHGALVTGGLATMDVEKGYLLDGTGIKYPGIEQFTVSFLPYRQMFIFQILDESGNIGTTPFAIHIEPVPLIIPQVDASKVNTDLYYILGFNREAVEAVGNYDAGSNTWYLRSDIAYDTFGAAADTDHRYAFSVHSDQSADLRGNRVLVLKIEELNNNDIALVENGPMRQFNVGSCMGIFTTRDPANVSDRILDINSNNYPIQKSYRNGRSRIKTLTVTFTRLDGSICNFGGLDHFITLAFTVKRSQPKKPVFAR